MLHQQQKSWEYKDDRGKLWPGKIINTKGYDEFPISVKQVKINHQGDNTTQRGSEG
jgi:hypothetical protein